MHIAPELLAERAKFMNLAFKATADSDIYALGCIVNQIVHQQRLADRVLDADTMSEGRKFSPEKSIFDQFRICDGRHLWH